MMLRSLTAFGLLVASPGAAWEFTPGVPCLLNHTQSDVTVALTYDPTGPLYSIAITRPAPFDAAAVFSMQFSGEAVQSISTNRHEMSNGNRTITVTDIGFGNVLDGLQFNETALAILGSQSVAVDLSGAAAPVAAFRACDVQPTA
ncbi:MAG: hypothetical protein AAF307_06170 [Pseudomonadota bacterium]